MKNHDTSSLDGKQINEAFETQHRQMRELRINKPKPVAESYLDRIQGENERVKELGEISAGRSLPYPTCSISEAARFIGTTEDKLKRCFSVPSLSAMQRPDGSLFSGEVFAHRPYIRKTLGLTPSRSQRLKKSTERGGLSLWPSREELIKWAGIKTNSEE